MDVNRIHSVIIIFRSSVRFEKMIDIVVETFFNVTIESMILCQLLISDQCI